MQMNAQKKISLHAASISSPMNSAFFLIWATFSACSALRDPVTLLSCPASSHRHSSDRPTVPDGDDYYSQTAARPLFRWLFPHVRYRRYLQQAAWKPDGRCRFRFNQQPGRPRPFGSGSNSSRSVNMIARPLMTPDELQLLPFGKWVVNRRSSHPFIANMPRYDKWGIRLEAPYISETREYVPTAYARLDDVIRTIKEEKWRRTVREKRESVNPSESVDSTADY